MTDQTSTGVQLNRIICILDNGPLKAAIKQHMDDFGYRPQFLSYSELGRLNGISVRGKSVVIVTPTTAINESDSKGMIDGGLIKLLASRIWKDVLAFREADSALRIAPVRTVVELSKWISEGVTTTSKTWPSELLLTMLYRRHMSFSGILRLAASSIWAQVHGDVSAQMTQARAELLRDDLIVEEWGSYTCSEFGRLVVEERTPVDELDAAKARYGEGQEPEPERWEPDDDSSERSAYLAELVLGAIQRCGWVTIKDAAIAAERHYVMPKRSLGKSRRFLEGLVARGILTKSVYNSGVGRPMFVFLAKKSAPRTADLFENTCGECAFYTRVNRRCRLWRALSMFNAQEAHEKEEKLTPIARDRLHNSGRRIGPNATSCELFAPKKKDYPLTKARDSCVCCGNGIDSPLAKTVRCTNCLTTYKPLATKVLVRYDYEHVFRERYSKLTGLSPPKKAVVLSDQEYHGNKDLRDIIILYPNERLRILANGIQVERGDGERTFESYSRIYEIVDYGALTDAHVESLKAKGVLVVQRRLELKAPAGEAAFPQYPSNVFVENLRWLEQNTPLRTRLLESAMLSTIVATRRITSRGGPTLQVLVNRQLLEYTRMKGDAELTLSKALAYEARVNSLYWDAYKTLLRLQGLEFHSRVRDRFVRETVQSVRARARGYSPANAAINYLHQRRLLLCRLANARAGIGWVGCEGVLHVAKRKPSIGLLLDLSDSFRLADRETFLNAVIRREVSREDFVARIGRHRVWFFHPTQEMVGKLDVFGSEADQFRIDYRGNEMALTGAYDMFVESFFNAAESADLKRFHLFVFGTKEDLAWLEHKSNAMTGEAAYSFE